jgi:arsenate reductase
MAEGLLRHLYSEKYEAYSAGTNPTQIHPLTVKVMAEVGIDVSGQASKSIELFKDIDIDVAVSVCQSSAKTLCALCGSPLSMSKTQLINVKLPKAKGYFAHGFSDPSEVEGTTEEKLAAFRRTRDEIKQWLISYFADLNPP